MARALSDYMGTDPAGMNTRLEAVEALGVSGASNLAVAACATTANITLSGEQTIDGVITSASRVLVKNQSTAAENGVYTSAAGAWSRVSDLNAAAEFVNAAIYVSDGTINRGRTYQQTATVTTVGTDAVTWLLIKDDGGLLDSVMEGPEAYAYLTQQSPDRVIGKAIPAVGNTGTGSGPKTTFDIGAKDTIGGVVVRIQLYIRTLGDGNLDILAAERVTASHTLKIRQSVTVTGTGLVTLYAGRDFDAFYIEKNWVLGVFTASGGAQVSITFAAGNTYFLASDPGSVGDTNSYTGNTSQVELNATVISRLSSLDFTPWNGLVYTPFGDSITVQAAWLSEFERVTGLVLDTNRGVNGEVLSGMTDGLVAGDLDDVDLALVGTGVNDWHHGSATVGSWGDTSSDNTIFGAVRKCIEDIDAINANTLPVFWGPFNSGQYTTGPIYGAANGNGLTIRNITEAMEEACERHGVPFYKTQARSGVNDLNIATWMPDLLHPGATLAQRHGRDFGAWVNKVQPR